jgi:hypothetical protein
LNSGSEIDGISVRAYHNWPGLRAHASIQASLKSGARRMEDHASVSRLAIARTAGGVIALVALWAQTDLALATTIE